MTDASNAEKAASETAKPPARKRGGGLKRQETPHTHRDDEPTGLVKVFGILLDMDRRGEIGRIIERWPVSSLTELRDAIDAAIEVVKEAGGADIGVGPFDVVLSHFPRGEGRPYRVRFKNPRAPVDAA